MDSIVLAKVAGLTSSGIFAGYTWALSHAAVPAILFAPEALVANQWREIYLDGFYVSRPLCLLNALSFGYLAYHAPEPLLTSLYTLAAAFNASGVPYALTFLRRTNGALSRRADRLAGPGNGAMALTYAFNEKRSVERDRKFGSTADLVRRWQWHNSVRTAVLVVGTLVGAVAVAMDGR
ncbi:hypothetical protein, variant [Exophiala xenobiotica]|uniref:DUF1772 domain-containing protein n=1 Tax=Exophiala xenobiotica TaxID=348802 RepID=A0A0D2F8S0_9EURO|nr:uncharacterized protein PV05_05092 [Exophiala xenobiotica]XP_013317013.1 hypothetical protein, variant [Exophiala xenobiotica]KIW56428.1 hypothetical protein PV05_05092 [Exophiala xenobiotica]KIW56429.1 hypothetical protein, variant [Exophiala xenobiotica]